MAIPPSTISFGADKFGVGQPVPRTEDPILVTGRGRYTDDLNLPGQAYVAMVRSTHAHGVLRDVDLSAARDMPGVLGAYSGQDLTDLKPLPNFSDFQNRDGSPMLCPTRLVLTTDKVRHVGDPVAFVVAETPLQAKEAAEAVTVDIEALPAVTAMREADKPGAPQLYDDVPNNLSLDFHYGDAEKVAAAFAKAAHVTRQSFVSNRIVVSPMEPRAAIVEYDPESGRWTFHMGTQGVIPMRVQVARALGVPVEQVRILTGHVGGSFGMKAAIFPEYLCAAHAARKLGRPVKWTDERSGSFVSDYHGRSHEVDAELALDERGRFLALRISGYGDLGAYLCGGAPTMSTRNAVRNAASLYATPLLEVSTRCVFTNTSAISAYRGAGRPEGNYYMERLIDRAAAEMGIDRIELRRRNQIRPKQLPFNASSGQVYDSGDFPAVLKHALEFADVKNFNKRKRESRKRGLLRGLGIGCYLEVTAPAGKNGSGIRFEPNGDVTILSGLLDYGQGHAVTFAQVLHDQLGVPIERIRLMQGDSDQILAGTGTGGSRSAQNGAAEVIESSAQVIAKGKQIASAMLEASASDIEFAKGRFVIAGTDRSIGLLELAAQLHQGAKLPDDVPATLDVNRVDAGVPSTFPNGCHVAEVEIDPETGKVDVVKYAAVNDVGTMINPLLVAGQVHGGVVQGIGQALLEHTVYDEDGQFLTGSYMDYALPRAHHSPAFELNSHPVPAKTNPLGVKGCGEAGCAGGLTSVMNAVVDALSAYGIRHIDMPATPARIWQAIQDAKAAQP